jgi:hypothetical protein
MPYVFMAAIRKGAACSAVAHSEGNGAPSQELALGAIARSCEAADSLAARGARKEADGIAIAEARPVRKAMVVIFDNISVEQH